MSAAFEATYSGWVVRKLGKVVQIILEVPLEYSDKAYQVLGGMPNAAAEVWVGVARLDPKVRCNVGEVSVVSPSQPTTAEPTVSATTSGPVADARTPPRALNPYAKRAGTLCTDIRFQKFLADRYGIIVGAEAAATKVRELCEVTSRAEILPGTSAADRFDILESAYRVETRV